MKISYDYTDFINCTDNKNDEINIIIKYLLLSISVNIKLLSFKSLIKNTMVIPFLTHK